MFGELYDWLWLYVGFVFDCVNFMVDDCDCMKGLYFVCYVDLKDLSLVEQGFWSQLFYGKKEKQVKQYCVNVKVFMVDQMCVVVVDDLGVIDLLLVVCQIMGLFVNQFC